MQYIVSKIVMRLFMCNTLLERLFSSYFCESIGEVAALQVEKPLHFLEELDPWTLA